MDILGNLAVTLLPAALVLYGMYLTVRSFLRKDFEKKLLDSRLQDKNITLPLRLQAYERLSLFMERSSPGNLLSRTNDPSYTATQFKMILINEVRSEFSHNFSQQIYVSRDAWEVVRNSVESLVSAVNEAANGLDEKATSTDLAKKIFERIMETGDDYTSAARLFINNEVQQMF